jgi:hypothetical protein
MKGLSVILTIALLVLASRLATRIKPAATALPSGHPPSVPSPVLNSTVNAWLAASNHVKTIPKK